MDLIAQLLLNLVIWAPILVALLMMVFLKEDLDFLARPITILTTFAILVGSGVLFLCFETGSAAYQFVTRFDWVETAGLNIDYFIGLDGINVGLVCMASVVGFAATACSWEIREREKEFYVMLLLMIGGIIGSFASLDLFFMYFFHELALVPTFIMIGKWGRGKDRVYATYKITMYLTLGALLALAGLIMLYLHAPASGRSFSIDELSQILAEYPIRGAEQATIFGLLMFGFGILVSLWPFHTWAPIGYGSAPTATAMMHAGVIKKFGLYGLIRVALPLLPEGAHHWMHVLAWLCLGNILYCGLVAIRQRDLNLLIGNSSVAHMGFVFLGIASLSLVGVMGAVMIMVAHGLLAALTFGLSGYLYNQTKTLDMDRMGGLLNQMPFFGSCLVMAFMAGCGLPGFANFVGEVMVFFGSWKLFPIVTVFAVWGGLVIGGVYMLRAIRSILHGPAKDEWLVVSDTDDWWRRFPFALLIAVLIFFGCFPGSLTNKIRPSADVIVSKISATDTDEWNLGEAALKARLAEEKK